MATGVFITTSFEINDLFHLIHLLAEILEHNLSLCAFKVFSREFDNLFLLVIVVLLYKDEHSYLLDLFFSQFQRRFAAVSKSFHDKVCVFIVLIKFINCLSNTIHSVLPFKNVIKKHAPVLSGISMLKASVLPKIYWRRFEKHVSVIYNIICQLLPTLLDCFNYVFESLIII